MAADPVEPSTDLQRGENRRVEQLCLLLLVGLPVMAATNLFPGRGLVLLMIAAGWCLAGATWLLSRRGRHELAKQILLVALFVILSLAMWFDQGPYNGAMLGYAAILVMAALLAKPRVLLVLLVLMVLVQGLFNYAAVAGWQSFDAKPLGLRRFVNIVVLLGLVAATAWLLANDLRRALLRLDQENQRVRQSQASLSHLAQHDALTGLPNRLLLQDRLEQALTQARRHQCQVALLYLDLDNFKTVNDSLGHAAGDNLLKAVARRLGEAVREIDTVSRQGGDEFLIVLGEIGGAEDAAQVARKILASLAQPVQINGVEVVTSCSIGIALYPQDGSSFAELSQHADTAMYQAKESGRRAFRFFDAQMNANLLQQLQLDAGLRAALRQGEFILHYQPIVELASGRLQGAEVLIRWQHPEQGLISPERFIPVAERSGLIVEIGEWVLGEACRQLSAWLQQGLPRFVLAINLSPVQFRRGNLDLLVQTALQRAHLPAECLELELTETVLLHDSADFAELLERLKGLGVRLAIDDFGTGYSNLAYLQRFRVDKLKIDRSFVREVQDKHSARTIVTAIIGMAHSLGLTTTAEGIEDPTTAALLAELGCEQGQGYQFARPLNAADFADYARVNLGVPD